MNRDELQRLIADVQNRQSELNNVEVKAARGGIPQRLFEPVSAFANRTGGGVLLFGLDESHNFEVVGVENAQRLQERIADLASNEMEPALRPEFTVDEIDGETVVAVEIEETPAGQKPCHYKPAGLQKGSYIRVGNTNRLMTDYEIFGYVSARDQPKFDEEPMSEATVDDLDPTRLQEYLRGLRSSCPKAPYLNSPDKEVLSRLHIVWSVEGVLRPTLAGLLVFGKWLFSKVSG